MGLLLCRAYSSCLHTPLMLPIAPAARLGLDFDTPPALPPPCLLIPPPGLWTDDERREVVDGIRPWIIRQALVKQQAERAAQAAAGTDANRGARDQAAGAAQMRKSERGPPMPPRAAQPLTEGPDAVWGAFIDRARTNLHWVLAMSPAGDAFRSRCRQFPSLTSCTTIDWFSAWPEEALLSVAQRAVEEMPALQAPVQAAPGASTIHQRHLPSSAVGAATDAGSLTLVKRAALLAMEVHVIVQASAERFHQELCRRCVPAVSPSRKMVHILAIQMCRAIDSRM